MKTIFKKVNQKGTMLVEAMAMLGLIAMVTPILYKKAAERTTELQDINAASQLRALASAMDSYLKDNFSTIVRGETVSVPNCPTSEVNFANLSDDEGSYVTFPLTHLCSYLPYGFVDDANEIQETKMFMNEDGNGLAYQVVVKMEGSDDDIAQTITGFLTAIPKEADNLSWSRASRIATMVGSNGGYIDQNKVAMGAQGIWSSAPADLGLGSLPEKSFVISSLQPISQGASNEDLLHRKDEPDNDDLLNTMETDMFMGFAGEPNNIRLVNQIIMSPVPDRMVGNPEDTKTRGVPDTSMLNEYQPDLKNALYIANGGGAYIEGALSAMDSVFEVGSEANANGGVEGGISYYRVTPGGVDGEGTEQPDTRGDRIFGVTSEALEYGNIVGKNGTGASPDMLLRVTSTEFNYQSPQFTDESATPPGGEGGTPPVPEGSVMALFADRDRMSAGNHVFQVTKAEGSTSYTNNWSTNDNNFAVVVGGDSPRKAMYTEYTYTNGVALDEGVDITEPKNWALTVYGPMFVKDMIETAKLKARDVDAAVLRGGSDPADYANASQDGHFYTVARTGSFAVGNIPVSETDGEGNVTLTNDQMDYHKLRIVNENSTEYLDPEGNDNPNMVGTVMRHDSGVDITSGFNVRDMLTARTDLTGGSTDYFSQPNPVENMVRIAAEGEVALTALDSPTGEGGLEPGIVSIQEHMLQAGTSVDATGEYDTITSVVDNFNIVRESDGDLINHPELTAYWNRDLNARDPNLLLGDMGLSIQSVRESSSTTKGGELGMETPTAPKVTMEVIPQYGENVITTRFTGGVAIYDYNDEYSSIAPVSEKIDMPAVYVGKGTFEVRSTEDNTTTGSGDTNRNYVSAGEIVFQVDNNADETVVPDGNDIDSVTGLSKKGSVYVRRGAINIATAGAAGSTTPLETDSAGTARTRIRPSEVANTYAEGVEPVGYISADRFIANVRPDERVLNIASTDPALRPLQPSESYDTYEVNPAYTSVMHDIKLTTRGGARLSDVLPDFINKGIYVVDNTYDADVKWSTASFNEVSAKSNNAISESEGAETEASAWLGFVPTPQCPPGYSKVITINPSGWAMAQAGTPSAEFRGASGPNPIPSTAKNNRFVGDILTHNNPFLFYWTEDDMNLKEMDDQAVAANPLTFQKNTWLKAMVVPKCGTYDFPGSNSCENQPQQFTGWSAVMGFIYPYNYFKKVIDIANDSHSGGVENDDPVSMGAAANQVYWNLFPVFYRQLEAYATVYCYFERKNWREGGFNSNTTSDYVDTDYDQLNNQREFYDKNGGRPNNEYIDRLNDPALKYNDPW